MKKRTISCLIALALILGISPGHAWAGEGPLCPRHTLSPGAAQGPMPSFYSEEISLSQEEPIVLDLADGDIFILAGNYMQGDNFAEHFGSCVITQSDPDTPVTAVINIVQAVDTVNITIEDIFIDASNGERAAIDIM